jgi:hypothetical protein
VLEWLGANEPKLRTKSATYLAGLPAGIEGSARTSAENVIANALSSDASATIENLLTSAAYATDPAIQAIAQQAGNTGDTAETGRGGLLMHPQVLAAHTKEDGVSPFRLGVFLREDLLCEAVAPPPAGAQAQALADIPGASLREKLSATKTAPGPQCLCMPTRIRSASDYAFLPFDPGRAVGLTHDPVRKPWDSRRNWGLTTLFRSAGRSTSAHELVARFGAHPQVHGCFAQAALSSGHFGGIS